MNLKSVSFGAALSVVALLPITAHAELLNFVYSGSQDITFSLDSQPTPSGVYDSGSPGSPVLSPYFTNISGTFGGVPTTFDFLTIYVSGNFGGFSAGPQAGDLPGPNLFDIIGPQIFTGDAAHPIFAAGSSFDFGGDTLTISAAVPEPSTWAMMILGFAGVGFMAYRRRNQSIASPAA